MPYLYSIRNWEEHYENNRSRTVKELSWVPIPNRHDGFNYAQIMAHERASEIFTAWILSVQVASRCQPRGRLLRDDGKPHDSASLAVKTRGRREWFEFGLDWLYKNTDWLDRETVATSCQQPVRQLPASCQAGDEEGNGREGNSLPPPSSPVVDEPPNNPRPGGKSKRLQRNTLLDALVSLNGTDPDKATSPMFGRAGKALKIIREVCPDVTPEEINRRAENYRQHYPSAECTSTAIAANWAKCENPPPEGGRKETPGIQNI